MDNSYDISFTNTFSSLTSEELVNKAKNRLSDFRYTHCVRTAKTSVDLAKHYGLDVERAKVAGFLHDYAKEIPVEEYVRVIKEEGFDQDLLNWNRGILHGVVGVYFIEKELDVHDEQILNAIRNHTTGSPNMAELDKVIFLADFIEPGRKFAGVEDARSQTALSLDDGVGFELRHTLTYLIEDQAKVYPKTLASYNVYGVKQSN